MNGNKKTEVGKRLETAKKNRWFSWPGVLCAMVVCCVSAGFLWRIWKTQFVPAQMMQYLCIALGVVLLAAVLLLLNHRHVVRFVLGILLAAGMIVGMVTVGNMVKEGVEALERITTAESQIEYIGIYVRKDDQTEHLEDAAGNTFGLWTAMDEALTEKVMTTLNEALKTEITTVGYDTLPELLDALYNGEVDSIIFPDAFFDLLEDMEGYSDVQDKIRPLITLNFEMESGELEKPKMPDHTFSVYISGIDSRNGLLAKSRSDVNILAYVNTKTRQVLLISTPRDYFVPLSISNGVPDKLTHAGIYGVNVSKDTLGMIYGVDIDYHFRVNFEGFEEIIDSLGGVEVNSEYAFSSNGVNFKKGINKLSGEQALIFARERYSLPGGDRDRGKNQMEVIRGVINKVLSPELLKSYTSVLKAVEGNFETTVPYELVAELVRTQLEKGGDWEIVTYSVDGRGDSQIPYSLSTYAYVMVPNETTVNTAKEMIRQLENSEIVTKP